MSSLMNLILFNWPIPSHLPTEIQIVCNDLRAEKNQEAALQKAYELLSLRFGSSKWLTYVLLWRIFDRNLHRIWQRTEFLHCTHMNWLLKILLVRSGWFAEDDITERWTILSGFSPHQYVRVRLKDGRSIAVDVWGRTYGVPLGKYAHGFKATTFPVWNDQSSPT